MSLNESIGEDSSLECFWELGYAVGRGPQLAHCESVASRDAFGEPALAGRWRQAPHRLNLFLISSRRLATPHDAQLPRLLSVAVAKETVYA